MNKRNIILLVLGALLLGGIFIGNKFFSSNTKNTKAEFLFIKTGDDFDAVKNSLKGLNILKNEESFEAMAKSRNYIGHVKPGRYEIQPGMSNFSLVRMLRSGAQKPVKLVLNKYRLAKDVAKKIGDALECDSAAVMQIMNDNAFLKTYNLDSSNSIAAILPNTYEFNWNTDAKKVFEKIAKSYTKFWNEENTAKAKAKNLTPMQAITLASIVDEETQHDPEKGKIASVYLNRLTKGMKLQADPTVKYAVGDFSIKRVLLKHLAVASPYNTYYTAGLPPGPICTPEKESIEAVLDAPKTEYLFFCASPDKVGTHNFAATDAEHSANAKKFQAWLDSRGIKK
jgi:UPF0755 protein